MKNKLKILMPVVLVFLITAFALKPVSNAQTQRRSLYLYDSGVVTVGPNQILQVTVNALDGNDAVNVQFRRQTYDQSVCNGGICRLSLNDDDQFPFISVPPGEAVSSSFPTTVEGEEVRYLVRTNQPAGVNVHLIDAATGATVAMLNNKNPELTRYE